MYKLPYNCDNGLVAFGYKGTYPEQEKKPKRKPKLKPGEFDPRRAHRPSDKDSEHRCPIHNEPLKRYETNKNRFRGYDAEGKPIYRGNIFYRCNHCQWAGLPAYYPENYFTERLLKTSR